jgi:SPX domain protein involved in polyphosphate accumulation
MSFRIEKKILINKFNLFEFKKKIFSLGATTLFKNRKVQSLYFDNLRKQMYNDSLEGLAPRKKIRVRDYPKDSNKSFKLETKISSVEGRHKTTKKISKEYFEKIKANGYFDQKYGLCTPLLNVLYEREYLKKDNIRITIDTDIIYNIYNGLIKKKDESVVVELKASKNMDIDDLFEQFPFQEIRFSKYCRGIELFNRN